MRPKRSAGKLAQNIDIDVIEEEPRWEALGLEAIALRAARETFAHLQLRAESFEAAVLGVGAARIAALNEAFRGKPVPTNVLSWPAEDLAREGGAPHPPSASIDGTVALGDIAICYDTCAREAEIGGLALSDHVTHLIVHGLLHLLGYDHENDTDAELMERAEVEILGKLGIDDPYRE